jgi:hypothetical protein
MTMNRRKLRWYSGDVKPLGPDVEFPDKVVVVSRRTFTLIATAGAAAALVLPKGVQALDPDEILVMADARRALPDQDVEIQCLDEHDRPISGMTDIAKLRWIDNEYRVVNRIVFYPDRFCVVGAFTMPPIIGRGTVDQTYHLFGGDMLELRVTLTVAANG